MTEKRSYFVTAIRGKRVAFLVGPFADHETALSSVAPARALACRIDPWCDFDLFGTCSKVQDSATVGKLNRELGLFLEVASS